MAAADVVIHPLYVKDRAMPIPGTEVFSDRQFTNDVDIALVRLSTPINPSVTYNREVSNVLTSALNGVTIECFGFGRVARGQEPAQRTLRSAQLRRWPRTRPARSGFGQHAKI